ncbi:ribokinase [Pygmaiobacter massiliensis]|uniref:ribokinase n=1 Tax=Pygmaiobacter massiliensis TaxID=1917873 RepID=UPI002A82ECAF|nr:ribokinase [Pygmaiobacter massiliensis]MDY4783313.1 ribokinase [Pygmaiobacter massiliensis]
MKILNFGSLNIDNVYQVDHFVRKGETISSKSLTLFSGGKGLNQSVALGRAGAKVWHAGSIGKDGLFLLETLRTAGVNVFCVRVLEEGKTGNAIIQNDAEGDNCILLYGGANQRITREQIDETLSHFSAEDFLVLQNEVNELPYLVQKAHEKGMRIVLNPSPMDEKIFEINLSLVDLFVLNDLEAAELTGGTGTEPATMLALLQRKFPSACFVLTLGPQGAYYADAKQTIWQEIYPAKVVDTTAAGDTFTGYFLAAILEGKSVKASLGLAAKAAAIAVSRPGAAPSIPKLDEVLKMWN